MRRLVAVVVMAIALSACHQQAHCVQPSYLPQQCMTR